MKFNPKHIGSSLDEVLEEFGILEEATDAAIKSVLALKFQQEMKKKNLSKIKDGRSHENQPCTVGPIA